MRDLILLKIGGSVCTEKSAGKFRVRPGPVARIAAEIAEARKQKPFRLIAVNGAGPFGHVNVLKYDINDGLKTARDYEGFAKTVSDCSYLNCRVAEIMRRKGVLAYPLPSSSVVIQSRKRISYFCTDVIRELWASGEDVVPVMNGTMVPDIGLGGSVVSGDAIIAHLAGAMATSLIIFATDVDGIYTMDPRKNRRARLIEEITRDGFDGFRKGISGSSGADVTGGMLGKAERLLSLGCPSSIVNGNRPGRVRDALLGRPVRGTVIKPSGE